MKKITLLALFALALATSCTKPFVLDYDDKARILDEVQTIDGYDYGYILKGQATISVRNDSVFANYAIARLYTDTYHYIGEDMTAKVSHDDKTQVYKSVMEFVQMMED